MHPQICALPPLVIVQLLTKFARTAAGQLFIPVSVLLLSVLLLSVLLLSVLLLSALLLSALESVVVGGTVWVWVCVWVTVLVAGAEACLLVVLPPHAASESAAMTARPMVTKIFFISFTCF
jgi:hypothetical protein